MPGEACLAPTGCGVGAGHAGQNKANPLGAIGSVAAMLSCSFGLEEEAAAVEAAMEAVLQSGKVTADLRPSGAPATTEQVGESVCAAIG